jgi:hypothetical protein
MYGLTRYRVALAPLIILMITGCSGSGGGGNTTTVPTVPANPVFTSTPVTQAVEGSPYSYQLAVSGATGVTFSLTTAPTGATISGSTVSWTPTTPQARVQNNFIVTASASGGGSATQSWTVTPSGTIRISRIDTLWSENGSTSAPFDWSTISSSVAALVPQANGSFQTLSGTAGANGAFQIPNVPAGYFWLKLGPQDIYWTSSSTFDLGGDTFVAESNSATPAVTTTNFNLNFTSLDPTASNGLLRVDSLDSGGINFLSTTNAGSTTFSGVLTVNSHIDFSTVKNAFVVQYDPASFGTVNGFVSGPELTLSNLSLTTGGQNTMSGALGSVVPASINLSVQSSAWTPLFITFPRQHPQRRRAVSTFPCSPILQPAAPT